MRVLLVEDSPTQARATALGLEKRGARVHFAPTLDIARKIINSESIDVILLDLGLPGSTGIDTVRYMRSVTDLIPIVIFTSDDNNETAHYALKNGAQDYLVKGQFSEDLIERSLRYAIDRKAIEQEMRRGERRLQAILENSYDAFFSMDSTWRITALNAQAEKMFGWKKHDAIGQSVATLIPQHLRRQYMRVIAECFAADKDDSILKTSKELTCVHRDGHEFPIEVGIFRLKEESDYMFCAFAHDLTEQKKSSEEMERLVQERTAELQRSNEELRQFAKIASHDLQEPLRAVEGFANLLAETSEGKFDKDQMDFLNYILDGTKRMQQLIRAVLVHSEVDKKTPESEVHTTSCTSVIDEVLRDLRNLIRETETTFDIGELPEVAVDHTLMVQLMQNLISNGIKYRVASRKPHITIQVEQNLGRWMFSIRDNGIGIDPKYSATIFDMFARLHSKSEYPGTGMGLAICKKIVESHGGNIWVESKPGEGSIFMFTLPTIKKARRAKMKDGIQILLVEDTPSDVRLTQEALKRSDLKYDLNVCNDGVEAMEYLENLKNAGSHLPDIILLDLNMPKKNGHQVLEEIKADPVLRPIPVVLVTVSERDEDVWDALKTKMNYYVAKPITAQKLSVLLRSIHELHSASEEEHAASTDEEIHVRLILASNPHTAPIALTKLADDSSDKVRSRVAENPQSPIEILEKLAKDSSTDVRISIAENPKAPESIIRALAHDESDDVRLGVASNPQTPRKILEELTEDENIYVASNATKSLSSKGEAKV
ncbi:MAG: response regulator [Candidatus Obscuribacterales bacterium]|jgi:PAS domain S-box-containing protein|nr:response regulator [Candidatus Obscuribacterales bacterium]